MNRRQHLVPAVTALALADASLSSMDRQKLRIPGNFATEHPSSVAVEQVFKKEVARLTNGQVDASWRCSFCSCCACCSPRS